MQYHSRLLKISFSPCLGPFRSYKAYFLQIGAERLTFSQTYQLRLELSLICSIYT